MRGPIIIVGHYGSGKTEFSVNLCESLAESGKAPVLVDLDIVNPYFRSRERRAYFAEKNIRVISSNFDSDEDMHQDVPALAAAIRTCFASQDQLSIIDVGGDPVGATAVGQYAPLVKEGQYEMWFTLNANRPQTQNVEDAIMYLQSIEKATRLKITGLLNTTHLLRETSVEDIKAGDKLVREVAAELGIPVVYTIALSELKEELAEEDLAAPVFPIKMMMRPEWL